jgi:hypothetical protein
VYCHRISRWAVSNASGDSVVKKPKWNGTVNAVCHVRGNNGMLIDS